jgi:hypothetical protein
MFRFLSIFVVLSVGVATKQKEKGDQSWEEYIPTGGGFHVSFPKKPAVKEPSAATGNLHVAAVQRTAVDELGFVCQWKVRDKAFENKEAERAYLKGQQIGMVKGSKGKLIEEKEITTDGFLGLDFIVEGNNATLRSRSYVSGKRIVTIMVLGKDSDAVRSESAKRFLESFKESK